MGCFGQGNSRGDRKRLLDMDEKDRSVGALGERGVQCEKSERGGLFIDTLSDSLRHNSKWKGAPASLSVWG